MQRLRTALELLDETISDLEDKVGIDADVRRESQRKQAELLRMSRSRETGVLAVAQKVASRLDQAIEHVENIVRH